MASATDLLPVEHLAKFKSFFFCVVPPDQSKMSEKTDLTKWKLTVERGRQVWKYDPNQKADAQMLYDKYFLDLDMVCLYPYTLLSKIVL